MDVFSNVPQLPSSTDYRKVYDSPEDAMIKRFMNMSNPYEYVTRKLNVGEQIIVIVIENEEETYITSDLKFKIALSKLPNCSIVMDVVHAHCFENEDLPTGQTIIRRLEERDACNGKPDLLSLVSAKLKNDALVNGYPQKSYKDSFWNSRFEEETQESKQHHPLYLVERSLNLCEKEEFDRKLIQFYDANCVDLKRRTIEFQGPSGTQTFGEIVHNFSTLVKRVHCNSCFARMNLAFFHLDNAINCSGCHADKISTLNKPYVLPRGGDSRYIINERPGYLSANNNGSIVNNNNDYNKKHSKNIPVIPDHIKEALKKKKREQDLIKKKQSRFFMDHPMMHARTSFGEPLVGDLFTKSQIDIPPVEHLVLSSASDLYGEPLMPESGSWVTTDVSKFDSSDSSDSFTNYKENIGDNHTIPYHLKRPCLRDIKKEPLCDSSYGNTQNSINCFQVPYEGPIPFIVEEALIDSSAEAFKFLRVTPDPIPPPSSLDWTKLPHAYTVRNKNAEPCGRMNVSTLGDPRYQNSETVNGKTKGTIYFAVNYEIDSNYVFETSHLGKTDIPQDIMKSLGKCEKVVKKEITDPTVCTNRKRELPCSPHLEVRRLRLSSPVKEKKAPIELPALLKTGPEQPRKKKFSLKPKSFIPKTLHGMFNLKK